MLFSKKFITEIKVEGMSCKHCKAKVVEAIDAIEGVKKVKVDLQTGKVIITSSQTLDIGVIIMVVGEAGFNVV